MQSSSPEKSARHPTSDDDGLSCQLLVEPRRFRFHDSAAGVYVIGGHVVVQSMLPIKRRPRRPPSYRQRSNDALRMTQQRALVESSKNDDRGVRPVNYRRECVSCCAGRGLPGPLRLPGEDHRRRKQKKRSVAEGGGREGGSTRTKIGDTFAGCSILGEAPGIEVTSD